MFKTNRVGTVYADNLIGTSMTFDDVQIWTVSSGTGSCITDDQYAFNGTLSLLLGNTDPTNDIVAGYASQNTVFPLKSNNCRFAVRLLKSDASYEYTGEIKIFKNAVLLGTETFTLEDSEDGDWYTFVSDSTYSFVNSDAITFTIQLDGIAGHGGVSGLYIDGFQLYVVDDKIMFPLPMYSPPQKETVETNIVSKTSNYSAVDGDIVLADATTGNLTVTLQSASVNATITVKKVDSSVNLVILDGDGAETIDGSTTQNITNQWDSITVKSDGSNWYII